jgi:hypothetical protein
MKTHSRAISGQLVVAASGPSDIAMPQAKNAAAVKDLLKKGADVNAGGDGTTPHWPR